MAALFLFSDHTLSFNFSLSLSLQPSSIIHPSHCRAIIPNSPQFGCTPGSKNIHFRWAFTLIPGHEPPSSLWFANCASISTPGALLCGQRESSNKHLPVPFFFLLVNISIAFSSLRNFRPIAFCFCRPTGWRCCIIRRFPRSSACLSVCIIIII